MACQETGYCLEMVAQAQAVTVSLADLTAGTVSFETLREAFGPNSLGILVVKGVPDEFPRLRRSVLSYASYLAHLPAEELEQMENAKAKYLIGWSRGKETLRNGQADSLKGSFYANCAFYVDPALECAQPTAEFSAESFPEYLAPNVWPREEVLPRFRPAVESLCRLIIDVAVLVARVCDRFAEQEMDDYSRGYLDHGCLTGLTSAMFVDEVAIGSAFPSQPPACQLDGGLPPLDELSASPDPSAGLYIKSCADETVQVRIPRDCIAFQTGEALERITAGCFKAVPHFVRGVRAATSNGRVARNTLAVFTQPNLADEVDRAHLTFVAFARGVVMQNTL